jgi:isoleucyl-tRNA synthetase
MHKSWGNAIEFNEAAEKMGADVMRWMYFTHDPATNVNFGYGPADIIRRRFFLILWNSYRFFADNANVDGFDPVKSLDLKGKKFTLESFEFSVLDRWVIAKLYRLVSDVETYLDGFDAMGASRTIEDFVVRDLSQWYIRRSRSRFGPTADGGEDKRAAYATLYSILIILAKLLAPFTPFVSEEIYLNLVSGQKGYRGSKTDVLGADQSVHLSSWPKRHDYLFDKKLLRDMDLVREVVEKGHSFRKGEGIPLRQPLASLEVSRFPGFASGFAEELESLLAEELNVEKVTFKKGKGELALKFDTKLTSRLKAKGHAREMVREIQSQRRKKGLSLNERIAVTYPDSSSAKEAVSLEGEFIKKQTLAEDLKPGKGFTVTKLSKS